MIAVFISAGAERLLRAAAPMYSPRHHADWSHHVAGVADTIALFIFRLYSLWTTLSAPRHMGITSNMITETPLVTSATIRIMDLL